MLTRRTFMAAAAFAAAVSVSAPSAFADQAELEAFIQSLSQKAITELSSATSDKARAEKLLPILQQFFDMPKLAKHTLGLYWKRATPEEQSAYVDVFTQYMSAVYGKRFAEYSGQSLAIQKVRETGDVSTVFTIVKGAEGEPRVDWDVSTAGGNKMITDVRVEGLSLAETHRQEFSSVISSNGGKVSALIDILKKKVGSL
ncbi:MlaC/ttg2D family ABC transporter substrate-binding protein [Dongia rigui]|uniref:ABC transporter substrate-binding protein n=1 Tax=Dongia rigui TaxID=940149 RepID=A0ABU5DUP8_9PROT|nr:ABC transporter substrate-binding protein [Dongia rigui]MDY0871015.1 ABC transporter substrate-binding protein [Dongia rigui]